MEYGTQMENNNNRSVVSNTNIHFNYSILSRKENINNKNRTAQK